MDKKYTLPEESPQMEPYTMEELNARIDEAEAEKQGMPATDFFAMVENTNPWLCR